jgi:enoyl-CoA hydratase
MLLACERLDHAEALANGLVDRTGSREDALAWAAEIAGLAPLTLAYNKLAVNRLFEDARDPETLDAVGGAFAACWASEDLVEGRRAREEKRPAQFRGR